MKGSDRMIFSAVACLALLAAFYMMVLSPKRQEASKLNDDVETLRAQVDEQEQIASFAEEARREFPQQYGRVVVMGKAVPDEADSASLLVQLSAIADRTDVNFAGIELGEGSGAAGAVPAPTATTPPSATEGGEEPALPAGEAPTGGAPTVTSVDAPATEAAAASLPIGASVGPAGFPTLPYTLSFDGEFFDLADFIAGLDQQVYLKGATTVIADGRLLTVDGFALEGGAPGSDPTLQGMFAVTSYTTPSGQGLTMGATPTAPAPNPAQPQAVPASSTVAP